MILTKEFKKSLIHCNIYYQMTSFAYIQFALSSLLYNSTETDIK